MLQNNSPFQNHHLSSPLGLDDDRTLDNRSGLRPPPGFWGRCLGVLLCLGLVSVPSPGWSQSNRPLTQAQISYLRNQVRFLGNQGRSPRAARVQDRLNPGDGVSTAAQALAELRFNDGSLARVGERAVFWFVPNSRNFQLSNGTALMLIPPGQGRTRIRTPNAVAGVEGSALFVRHIEQTQKTLVGALTDSGITVCLTDSGQCQTLAGGQMAEVDPTGLRVYKLDLAVFYSTSELTSGLNLDTPPTAEELAEDPLAAVRLETTTALEQQVPLAGDRVVTLPPGLQLPPASEAAGDNFPSTAGGIFNPNLTNLLFPAEPLGMPFMAGLEGLGLDSNGEQIPVEGRSVLDMAVFHSSLLESGLEAEDLLNSGENLGVVDGRGVFQVGEIQVPGLSVTGSLGGGTTDSSLTGTTATETLTDPSGTTPNDRCPPGIIIARGNNPNNDNIGKNFNCP